MKSVILDIASLGDDVSLTALREAAPQLREYSHTRPEEAAGRIADHDIVIVNKVPVTAEVIQRCPNLKLVAVTATGTNNIDHAAARAAGIEIANVNHYATASLVQHTFALIFALTTRLPDYSRDVQAGRWATSSNFCLMDHPIRELEGRTLGIIGAGDLGQAVARAGSAFGMKILFAARPGAVYASDDTPPRTPFGTVLAESDVLSLHCLLSDATRGLIGARELRLMRRDALLINTARGGLVDEQALATALREGLLGGAGVDVLSEEPPVNPNPLLAADLPNLIITPHCAWASREARQRLIDKTAHNIRYFLERSQPA